MKESEILNKVFDKLNIKELNKMQNCVLQSASACNNDLVLLSPTGSGKTLAFIIPLLKSLKEPASKVQAVIIAPSRELVIQIFTVLKSISENYKISVCYGGHNVLDEKQSLAVTPDIIVSTPGRLLDHINRNNIDVYTCKYLILDEFDKSLDLGFQEEMEKIIRKMPNVGRKILTSATNIESFPAYLRLKDYKQLDFIAENTDLRSRLTIRQIDSPSKDKLETLSNLLYSFDDNGRCIIFVNYRDAVERINNYLRQLDVPVGFYHGGLEQIEREKAIELFNNGTFLVLVSTDLGSRGLDIVGVEHIIHYHLPPTEEVYTHRNGRAARVDATGMIDVIIGEGEKIPTYIDFDSKLELSENSLLRMKVKRATIYFHAGKKEKISKSDIVGFLINKGGLEGSEIGIINSHDHYTLASVPVDKIDSLLEILSPQKIKNKKIKISKAMQL